MRKVLKKGVAVLLAAIMLLGCCSMAYASDQYLGYDVTPVYSYAEDIPVDYVADILYASGFLKGSGTLSNGFPNYNLTSNLTRAEAVTVIIRLLGKADAAENDVKGTPFTDVPSWAIPYVSYAYNNNITKGTSATTFTPDAKITLQQFATMLLRALGYSDTDGDFSYKTAVNDLYAKHGIKSVKDDNYYITRTDMTYMVYNALMMEVSPKLSTESKCLAQYLGAGDVYAVTVFRDSTPDSSALNNLACLKFVGVGDQEKASLPTNTVNSDNLKTYVDSFHYLKNSESITAYKVLTLIKDKKTDEISPYSTFEASLNYIKFTEARRNEYQGTHFSAVLPTDGIQDYGSLFTITDENNTPLFAGLTPNYKALNLETMPSTSAFFILILNVNN